MPPNWSKMIMIPDAWKFPAMHCQPGLAANWLQCKDSWDGRCSRSLEIRKHLLILSVLVFGCFWQDLRPAFACLTCPALRASSPKELRHVETKCMRVRSCRICPYDFIHTVSYHLLVLSDEKWMHWLRLYPPSQDLQAMPLKMSDVGVYHCKMLQHVG